MADDLGIRDALNYSLKRKKGLLNAYWLLIPIIGWAVYYGYYIQIIDAFRNKKRDALPLLGGVGSTMKSGFWLMVFSFILGAIVNVITLTIEKFSVFLGVIVSMLLSLMVFVQVGLYVRKQNFRDALDLNLAFGLVQKNFWAIIVLWLRALAVAIICMLGSIFIITIPIMIPIMVFATSALAADLYVTMYGQIEKKSV